MFSLRLSFVRPQAYDLLSMLPPSNPQRGRHKDHIVATFARSAFCGLIRYSQWMQAAQVCHVIAFPVTVHLLKAVELKPALALNKMQVQAAMQRMPLVYGTILTVCITPQDAHATSARRTGAHKAFDPFHHNHMLWTRTHQAAQEHWADAVKHLHAALQEVSSSVQLAWLLAQLYCAANKPAEARTAQPLCAVKHAHRCKL